MVSEEEQNKQLLDLERQKTALANAQLGMSVGPQQHMDSGPMLIKEQLSLGEELETLDNLIQSKELIFDEVQRRNVWVTPDVKKDILNEDKIILSDYGVHYFRQIIAGYINKNTLLSNYDEEQILDKMKDIATVINDEIFLSYEKLFYQPSIERCKKEIDNDIKEQLDIRKIASELLNQEFDENKEKVMVVKELEYELQRKIAKIRTRLFNQKLKRFTFILRFIQDTIHSAYNRALGGQERRSLRQHMSVIETSGVANPTTENKGGGSWLSRKR